MSKAKTVKVNFLMLIMSIPHDHPMNDLPVDVVKEKYKDWLAKDLGHPVEIKWV
jgi:hypothetical protein